MIRIISGPPCAGKSTYVIEKASPGDIVIDFDVIAEALGSGTTHAADGDVAKASLAARDAAIGTVLAGVDADAWIIHTNPKSDQVETYREAGAEFVVLDPGIDECLKRAETDGRPSGTSDAIEAWYAEPPVITDQKASPLGGAIMDIDFKALEARAKSSETQYKTLTGVKFKTGEADLAEGEFLAYAAVFGNQDSYGDVIRPGAFLDSIAEYEALGKTIGFYFGHNMTDPDANLGWIISAKEDSFGLLVHGKFDLEDEKSVRTWKKVKGGRFDQLSFGYKILEGGWIESSEHRGGGFFELRKLHIYEVSVVPIGANEETHFVAVKAGKTLSAKNAEKINTAIAAVETALSTLKDVIASSTAEDPAPADSAKAAVQQTTTANTSEPSQDEEPTPSAEVKSSDSMRNVSAYMSAQLQLLALANGEN